MHSECLRSGFGIPSVCLRWLHLPSFFLAFFVSMGVAGEFCEGLFQVLRERWEASFDGWEAIAEEASISLVGIRRRDACVRGAGFGRQQIMKI